MLHAESIAHAQHSPYISLLVRRKNFRAIEFYKKMGYESIGRFEGFRMGEELRQALPYPNDEKDIYYMFIGSQKELDIWEEQFFATL